LISEQSNVQSENARLQKKSAEQIISMTLKQIETAKEVYRQTIFQLKEQSATLTDVLLADNAVREAQQSYLNAIIDYFKADLELKKVSGNFNATSN
jgi:outer membrane protein TolC